MKKIALFWTMVLTACRTFAQTPAQEIDEMLKQYALQNSFNGAALVAQNGQILLQKGYGYKNIEKKMFNDSNTVFQIGSITKQFTAVVILQLEEQRSLSLQDKLTKYIPGYPGGDSISIAELLTNSSGIPDYTEDHTFIKNNAARPLSPDELIATFENRPLDFPPGTNYNYSNSGYVLLGYIIEKVTGLSYFSVVRQRIFMPCGMNHSGFDFNALKTADKATGYIRASPRTAQPATIIDSSVGYAAGSIYSTTGDLFRWYTSLLSGKLIPDSSLQMAFTPHLSNDGFGWVVDSSYGKKVVMHEGSTSGFVAFAALLPADRTSIILLDNKSSAGLPRMAENINSILSQQPYDFPKPRQEIDVDTAVLRRYVGQYQLSPAFIITIGLENGQLILQGSSQGKNELFAERKNYFFMKLQDIQVEFISDAQHKTERLVLYELGQKIPAIKIK